MYKPISEADLQFLFGFVHRERPVSRDLLGARLRAEINRSLVESYLKAIDSDLAWIPAVLRELPRFGFNVPKAYEAAVKLYFSMRLRLAERIRSGRCLICEAKASPDAPLAIYCEAHGQQFLDHVVADDSLFERLTELLKNPGVSRGTAYRQFRIELHATFKSPTSTPQFIAFM